jgi:large repetitive protein
MNHSCHSTGTVFKTATRPVAVSLAFMVLVGAAGVQPAFSAIENTARGSATYNGTTIRTAPVTVSVPVAPGVPTLLVTKVATPDTNVPAGTVVTYRYTVRNTGNLVLTNIALTDVHNGAGTAPLPRNELLTTDAGAQNDSSDAAANDGVWSVLAPGDVVTLTATYTITQTDVDQRQ